MPVILQKTGIPVLNEHDASELDRAWKAAHRAWEALGTDEFTPVAGEALHIIQIILAPYRAVNRRKETHE